MRKHRACVLLLSVAVLAGCERDPMECVPVVRGGWVRSAPPGMPMAAGFGEIVNACGAPVTITGATSPAFGDVSLHETTDVDGVSRMRAVPALEVPADGATRLAPGGLHLMLSEPAADIAPGDRVVIDLALGDGRTLRGEFEVRPRPAAR